MSKVLLDTELLEIAKKIIETEEVICESATYERFLYSLGELIADYCGGDCVYVSKPLAGGTGDPSQDRFCLHFHWNDSVPDDGGVYKDYDTDITIEDWRGDK